MDRQEVIIIAECVRFKTLDAIINNGLIEEIEDDNPGVTYKIKK